MTLYSGPTASLNRVYTCMSINYCLAPLFRRTNFSRIELSEHSTKSILELMKGACKHARLNFATAVRVKSAKNAKIMLHRNVVLHGILFTCILVPEFGFLKYNSRTHWYLNVQGSLAIHSGVLSGLGGTSYTQRSTCRQVTSLRETDTGKGVYQI